MDNWPIWSMRSMCGGLLIVIMPEGSCSGFSSQLQYMYAYCTRYIKVQIYIAVDRCNMLRKLYMSGRFACLYHNCSAIHKKQTLCQFVKVTEIDLPIELSMRVIILPCTHILILGPQNKKSCACSFVKCCQRLGQCEISATSSCRLQQVSTRYLAFRFLPSIKPEVSVYKWL